MSGSDLIAVEAMTAGVDRLAEAAESHGYQLVLLAEQPSMYHGTGAAQVRAFPTGDEDALDRFVAAERPSIAGIMSSTDGWGPVAARLRERYGFPSRISSVALCRYRDKEWVQRTLTGQGHLAWDRRPVIVKPRFGTGSRGVRLAVDESEAQCVAEEAGLRPEDVVIQPYWTGPLYSAELWTDSQNLAFFGVTNRIQSSPPAFIELVKTFPWGHDTAWEESVRSWVSAVLDRLGYAIGLAHIEFVENADGFHLIELNARMPGALIGPAIDACTNYDPYDIAVCDALGSRPNLPPTRRVRAGHSHVSIYAHRRGVFQDVEGVDLLQSVDSSVHWIPAMDPGARVVALDDYRGRVGHVEACADEPGRAQDRAIAASQLLKVHVA